MRNKILFLIVSILFMFNYVNAQETTKLTMPTDEEIMMIINKFNFDKQTKEQLFKETKRTLQEKINNQDMSIPQLDGNVDVNNINNILKQNINLN